MVMDKLDVIIIGAGVYGIQAARTYLELHPTHNIIMLEADSCPGGPWGADRVYKNFWTQTPLGMFEFSDKKLDGIDVKDTYHTYFQAKHFTKYLDDYLDGHVYDGKTLRQRLVLNARVEKLWKEDDIWHAKTSSGEYRAPKVIDASGLTSAPNIPRISGANTFKGKMIHHKEFSRSDIPQTCKTCVIVGGAKSASDVAYSYAKAGLEVHWVIRKSGNGPAAYFPPQSPISYYSNSNAAFHTRLMANIIACIFTPETWFTRFLHQNALGRGCLNFMWSKFESEVYGPANYNRADGKANGFANLKPDVGMFWQMDSTGLRHHDDLYDTFAEKVKIYRQDISELTTDSVILADGTSIDTDAIVYATGWLESPSYLSPSLAHTLGLPAPKSSFSDPTLAKAEQRWSTLVSAADTTILARYPILSSPPPHFSRPHPESPFRLYKALLPITDHSIVFLGRIMLANHTYSAEVQALYAVAALDGTITLPDEETMRKEVATTLAWQKRRYPSRGEAGNWFFYDVVPYTDMMIGELGLKSNRVGGWRDWVAPTLPENLKGLVGEYKGRVGGKGKDKED
ncbi:hypothetical protein BCR34DRAFT_204898 [Clohesyomyces aquaticus]|uniref:FAD/NAD(P)-binding domain-containing protein n=1 Tax=Clohesyomyces aquaticus TaxID=1231657 RepID=A0A1Y1YAS0_9PLEO|nr:hypothetical protein BCR34DRAFT_204898 [Clohesyomyces aquaticus]